MNSTTKGSGYFALVLDQASARLLVASYATLPCPIAHHCTVAFNTDAPSDLPEYFSPDDLDRSFCLRVAGYRCREDKAIEAVAVEITDPSGNPLAVPFSTNRVPHVTVATNGKTRPFESNALLERGFKPFRGELLTATLRQLYTGSG